MDYSNRVGVACIVLILMLLGIGHIPAFNIGGVEIKSIDIISDLRSPKALEDIFSRGAVTPLEINEADYEVDMEELLASVAQTRELLAQHTPTLQESIEPTPDPTPTIVSEPLPPTLLQGVKVTPIENFDTTTLDNPFARLYAKLNNPHAQVRIAVLGDSFVEGDILTCDLRERLQSIYGGCGAGFAPFDSPLTRFRRTIKTTSEGWTTYNIMKRSSTPSHLSTQHFVSGWVSQPSQGATTRWEGSDARENLTSWRAARLLFMSHNDSELEVTVNDTIKTTHNIKRDSILLQLVVTHPDSISSISLKVCSGEEGFVGYGAIFDSGNEGGVVVDNYSVRSNNGQAILWTNPSINYQVDYAVGGYDLVILQYGLNIMQRGVNGYTRYSQQVEKIITYAKECFPSAAILVMGVSDRSMKEGGVYRPMREATHLTGFQRQAAQNTASAFWSTYDAMQAQGGMSHFVKQGWAGKDFTHINFAGGRQIAYALVDALLHDLSATAPPIRRHDFDNVTTAESRRVEIEIQY